MEKFRVLVVVCLLSVCVSFVPRALAAPQKPNIVVIVADDLGYHDVGFQGSEIRTPNIDALAHSGLVLKDFYVQPVCTQTRVTLMTGRFPHHMGLHNRVIKRHSTKALPLTETTLAEMLKPYGYQTAIVGKWHLGHFRKEFLPTERGFDFHFGNYCGFIDYYTHLHHGVPDLYRNEIPIKEEGYTTTMYGDEAVKYLDRIDRTKPFFLYLPFTAPHAKLQAPQQAIDKYANIKDPQRRLFAATVSVLDDAVGEVIRALRDRHLDTNTLIFFTSDNGASIRAGGDNAPLRGKKGDLFEGGIRVPAVFVWPGKIAPGTTSSVPVHMIDFFPTVVDILGGSVPSKIDGVSIKPLLEHSGPVGRETLLLSISHKGRALRKGDWKIIEWNHPQRDELYNLAEDIGEKNDLGEKFPQKLQELHKELEPYVAQITEWDDSLLGLPPGTIIKHAKDDDTPSDDDDE